MNKLMCDTDFLLLQEVSLYESSFDKLLKLDSSCQMVATSVMDDRIQRVGRPFGDTAIVWNSTIKGELIKIDCNNNRICGVLYTINDFTIMILNIYMPYVTNISIIMNILMY